MGRRFSRIKYRIKTGDTTSPIAEAYMNWLTGKTKLDVAAPARGTSKVVTVIPFLTVPGATAAGVNIKMSGRSSKDIANTGISLTDLGVKDGATDGSIKDRRYSSAKAIAFVPITTAPEPTGEVTDGVGKTDDTDKKPKSDITGLYYNRRLGNSFTLPYGKDTTRDTDAKQQAHILTQVATKTGVTVTFKPEKFKA